MKALSRFSKLLVLVVFVSILSVSTTFVMVNMYAEKILQSFGMNMELPKLSLSEFSSPNNGQGNTIDETENNKLEVTEEESYEVNPSEEIQDNAVEVWKRNSIVEEEYDSEFEKKEIVISLEDFNRTKDLLSDEDKMKIFSIIVSRIPPHEVQELSLLMEDGITHEELTELEKIIDTYLNQQEMDELLDILQNY